MASGIHCWIIVLIWLLPNAGAWGQGFSVGKNLHELRLAVLGAGKPVYILQLKPEANTGLRSEGIVIQGFEEPALCSLRAFSALRGEPGKPSLGPRWSAECLPFFCRIEYNFARTSKVPLKFRLGSVEYVDWLEGKRDFVPK